MLAKCDVFRDPRAEIGFPGHRYEIILDRSSEIEPTPIYETQDIGMEAYASVPRFRAMSGGLRGWSHE